jgi:hypothetical protein
MTSKLLIIARQLVFMLYDLLAIDPSRVAVVNHAKFVFAVTFFPPM